MEVLEYCPFCNSELRKGKVILETDEFYVMEPMEPVVSGHVMFIPKSHVEDFATDIKITTMVMYQAIQYAYRAGGDFNLITSKGEAATQSVMHLHVHLVPRTPGDSLKIPWGSINQTASV